MKKKLVVICLVLFISGSAAALWFNRAPLARTNKTIQPEAAISGNSAITISEENVPQGKIFISAPVTFKNLQVFYLYANTEIEGEHYVTLDDALNGKLIVVKETEDVNELEMDNHSNRYIYLNSGDIVRGGKQDRTIQYDVVIAPRSKYVKLSSFCVESGRWSNRGDENAISFSSSKNTLSSKELKIAAKVSKDQSEVWEKVGKYQEKANENISHSYTSGATFDIKSDQSSSSLELTLENKKLKAIKEEYRKKIIEKFINNKNAVGMACFINGKLSSIDIYNNHALFRDLFDKLIDATIAEAISEKVIKGFAPADTNTVYGLLNTNRKLLSTDNVNDVTGFSSFKTTGDIMLFITDDRKEKKWLHKNWLDTKIE